MSIQEFSDAAEQFNYFSEVLSGYSRELSYEKPSHQAAFILGKIDAIFEELSVQYQVLRDMIADHENPHERYPNLSELFSDPTE